MRFKVFYGGSPKYKESDKKDFNRGSYVCQKLMKTGSGALAVLSKNTDPKYPFWKVEHGYSCVVFAGYKEAMQYCRDRHFCEA